jgi:hypothetical protein
VLEALRALERVALFVARVAHVLRRLAVAAALADAVFAYYLLRDGADASDLVLIAVAGAPPVVVFLFSEALRALSELPARLRTLPADAQRHALDAAGVTSELRSARTARAPLLLWRLARLAASSRELATPHAAALPLVSIPFWLLSAAATGLAALEIVVAVVLLVVLVA